MGGEFVGRGELPQKFTRPSSGELPPNLENSLPQEVLPVITVITAAVIQLYRSNYKII